MAPIHPVVESSRLKGSKKTEEVVRCPKTRGSAQWMYERLKASTEVQRFVSDCSDESEDLAAAEYQLFKDLLAKDSLLSSARLSHEDGAYSTTFRNGSVVVFTPPGK